MASFIRVVAAAAAGALTMYFLDPAHGRRRRAVFCDKLEARARDACELFEGKRRHALNKARGALHQAREQLGLQPQPPDHILREQVRARMGHIISYPKAIDVEVHEGRVTLSGPVLAKDQDRLISGILELHGVHAVVNKLTPHEKPGGVPELQGAV